MATWQDNPVQNFNPYIQQLPVDALVKVGMAKQQRYNEGIQKIQTNIDNVAGLDIAKDVDKAYLQSQLNSLGSKLKTVAAGDFSNYQLVNSVSGMTNEIVKDKNIQTAVYSTAKYKKELGNRETYLKEGKTSPSNDWIFNKNVNDWMSDTNVGSAFTASYDPYVNWKKNSLEIIKALTKDESITDQSFTTDKRGNLVLGDATIRKRLAGISPEKIQQALNSTLSPADFKQMQIDSLYNYSNKDANSFKSTVIDSYSDNISSYTNQRNILQNAKESTTSVPEKNLLDAKIASLDKVLNSVVSQRNELIDAVDSGNLDGAKAQFGAYNAINGISRAFSFTETSETYSGKTPQEMEMWRQDKAQDWKKFQLNFQQGKREFDLNYNLKLKELEQSKRANDLKESETIGYGGVATTIDEKDVPTYTLDRLVGETINERKTLELSKLQFIKNNEGNAQWYEQQKAAWEKNPKGVSPVVSSYFNSIAGKERQVEANEIMIGRINKEAEQKFGNINNLIPKDAPNITMTYSSGRKEVYTPKDFVDFNSDQYKYVKLIPNISGKGKPVDIIYDDAKAKQELSPKAYALFNIAKKVDKSGINSLGAGDKVLYNNLKNYNKIVNQSSGALIKKINEYTAQEVTKRLTNDQAVEYSIPAASPKQKETISNNLLSFADIADSQKGGIANSPNFDSEVARKLAVDPSAIYKISVAEGTEKVPAMYKISVSGKEGTTEFKITAEQKREMFGNKFDSSPAIQYARPYLEQIRKAGGYSTAPFPGKSSPTNSYLNSSDFQGVNMYGVKGNLIKVPEGGYVFSLNIFNPITKKWEQDISYPRGGVISEDKIAEALQSLSDAAIYEIINDKPATPQDLKKVEQAIKKPL